MRLESITALVPGTNPTQLTSGKGMLNLAQAILPPWYALLMFLVLCLIALPLALLVLLLKKWTVQHKPPPTLQIMMLVGSAALSALILYYAYWVWI